jgi:hypothetical protein
MITQRPVMTEFMFLNTNTEGMGATRIWSRKFAYRFIFQPFMTIFTDCLEYSL